jgi:zinc transport system substrate-binding protein
MTKRFLLRLGLAVVLGCVVSAAGAREQPVPVAASIVPVATFVERVGGERVDVTVMVGPEANPATYEPTPRQMAAIGRSRAFFRVGVPFEQAWMGRIEANNPGIEVVDLRERLTLRSMGSGDHAHGHADGDRGQPDPHVWTDPRNVIAMAAQIRERLTELDPDGEAAYRANFRDFRAELRSLHAELTALFEDVEQGRFLVYHPAWGYFADAYGLEQIAVEIEGKRPSARSLSRVIERAREARVNAVFVQDQFARRSAERVAQAIDARVTTMDPLAADYVANMRRVGREFAEAVKP